MNLKFLYPYFKKLDLNKMLIIAGIAAVVFLALFLFWWLGGSKIIGIKNENQSPRASLTGLACDRYLKRPIAVMMASDPVARPLSGIGQADVVIEMPVTSNGITRMMAIFQCEEPEEIGSIRSARGDFLTLVSSFGALYAHWGGEAEALKKLNGGILDNIDAMKYDGAVFYRKDSIPRPHNGFTKLEFIEGKAKDLGYSIDDTFIGYLRNEDEPEKKLSNIIESISIDYESPYDVKWIYDDGSGTYKRTRGGEAEMDKNTGEQVETSIIVLAYTVSKVLNRDYITVDTVGEGEAEFYQGGIRISGTWKNIANDFQFYDADGREMKFIPGKMWIEVITSD